jgi:general secretion pathway protein D
MKRMLFSVVIAIATFWAIHLLASDLTNAPAEPPDLILEIIPVKYAKASDLEELLVGTDITTPAIFAGFGERLAQLVNAAAIQREVQSMGWRQVVADERSNSLCICAANREMIALKRIIATLDIVLPQILVEALVVEFSINDSNSGHRVGVQPHPGLTALGDLGLVATGMLPFRLTNNLARASSDLAYITTLRGNLDVIVNALTTNPIVKILQKPRIQTSEGVPAQFFIGPAVPYPRGPYPSGGYSSIQAVNIGTTFDVTCFRSANGLVQLKIDKMTEWANGVVKIANVGEVPITKREDTRAQLIVHPDQILAIGGIFETNKVPLLSEVELFDHVPGGCFLNKLVTYPKHKTRSELVILLRATVLPAPEDANVRSKDAAPWIRPSKPEMLKDL